MRRGVLCIGTGRYASLVPAFEQNLTEQDATDVVFCLTDDPELLSTPTASTGGVDRVRLPWGALSWPWPTLLRYHGITAYGHVLRAHATHLTYCDVDMRVVGDTSALFGDRVFAVAHPGQWKQPPATFPLEKDPRSAAHVAPGVASRYVAGGVQGGPIEAYLLAAASCARAVERDHMLGITAVWHDESHWNRYVVDHPETAVLGPEYCWPESWPAPADLPQPQILALDKAHHDLRGTRARPRERFAMALRHPALAPARSRLASVLRSQ